MKIVLISPKGPLYRHRKGIFKKSLRYAPLTLTTLAALVPDEMDADITLIDESIEDIPDNLEADLVGMTVITGTAPRCYELSARLRAKGIPVVLGGPHVTLIPQEAKGHADSIVVGYAENSWPQLLHDFAAGQMKARYDQGTNFNLDDPVFPDRHRLDSSKFLTMNVFEATRACIHSCDFCVVPSAWGIKPYHKPVAHVIEDIRRMKAKKLIFLDLNLIADLDYAAELFTALIPLGVRWFGLSTTLIGRKVELLDLMAKSGCKGLLLGLESISKANLKQTRKTFNAPDLYGDLIDKLHIRGISVMGCFVFGLDDDQHDVFDKTARFAIEAAIDLPRFAIVTPFPGTQLHKRLEKEDRIISRDWTLYDGQHVVFEPRNMSVAELAKGHEHAWRKTYTYSAIARRFMGARIQAPLFLASNLGYRYYAHHLHDTYNCDWFTSAMPNAKAAE